MFGREHGAKKGAGDLASEELVKLQRKERLRGIAAVVFDIKNDPYVMKNHIGGLECRLCSTPHPNEANYMVHTEGKRHKENLAKRMAQLNKNKPATAAPVVERKKIEVRRTPKIGRPGFKIVKQLDRERNRHSLLFRVRRHQMLASPRFARVFDDTYPPQSLASPRSAP
jgi:splicing factor 3A subunit 2